MNISSIRARFNYTRPAQTEAEKHFQSALQQNQLVERGNKHNFVLGAFSFGSRFDVYRTLVTRPLTIGYPSMFLAPRFGSEGHAFLLGPALLIPLCLALSGVKRLSHRRDRSLEVEQLMRLTEAAKSPDVSARFIAGELREINPGIKTTARWLKGLSTEDGTKLFQVMTILGQHRTWDTIRSIGTVVKGAAYWALYTVFYLGTP